MMLHFPVQATPQWKPIEPLSDPRWDTYVESQALGSVYHTAPWQEVIHRTYHYDPFCWVIEDERGGIVSAAACFEVRSLLKGSRIVSLPFSDFCDPLLSDEEHGRALLGEIEARLSTMRHGFVEFRVRKPLDWLRETETSHEVLFKHHEVVLPPTLEQLCGALHRDLRRNIRQAEGRGMSVREGKEQKDLDLFYELLVATRKRHGLPPQPQRFFANLWETFRARDQAVLWLAARDRQTVAGLLCLIWRDVCYALYAGSNDLGNQLHANPLLLWHAVEQCYARGLRRLDLGRTSPANAGLLHFKRKWDPVETDLLHYYYPPHHRRLLNRQDPRSEALHALASKLPAPALKWAGRVLYPHLG